MIVKAKTDFGGQYAMYKDDVAELPENAVTRGLILNGFIEEVEDKEIIAIENNEAIEDDGTLDLHKLSKDELLEMCEEMNIDVDKKAKKVDLVAAIEEAADGKEPEEAAEDEISAED